MSTLNAVMPDDEIKPGVRVDIVLRTLTIESVTNGRAVAEDDEGVRHEIDLDSPLLTVHAGSPEHWPPALGDVWRSGGGTHWFARDVADYDDGDKEQIELVSQDHYNFGGAAPHVVLRSYGPLTLVYRADTPTPAVGDTAAVDR